MSHNDKTIGRWLGLLLAVTFGWFFQSGQHNEAARLDLTRAIVEFGQLHIDRFAHNSADIFRFEDGHLYSNKAPGVSLAAVVPYYLFDHALGWLPLATGLHTHLVVWLVTFTVIGLPSAFAGVLLYRLGRRLGATEGQATAAALLLSLGTIAFPFATLLFSHQLTAVLLLAALYAVHAHAADLTAGTHPSPFRLVAGGLAAGFAVTTEYPAAFAVVLLHLYAAARFRAAQPSWATAVRSWLGFALPAVAGVAPLFVFNLLAYGKLWYTPLEAYAAGNQGFEAHKLGVLGLQSPLTNPNFLTALRVVTVGSQRGLFYCNPILLLVVPGVVIGLLRRRAIPEHLLAVAAALVFFTLNASYGTSVYYWGGGNSIGPRYMLLALPFAAVPLIASLSVRPFRWLAWILGPASILFMLAATAVEPRAPLSYSDPVWQLALPSFANGDLALCADGVFSADLVTPTSVAFNVGGLAGLPGHWQLAPLYLIWALGLIPLLGALDPPGTPAWRRRLRRAFVYGSLVAMAVVPPVVARARSRPQRDGSGLIGRYYPTADWSGEPRFIRHDPVIAFDWTDARPFPGKFSVAWQGRLTTDEPGTYTFATVSDDASWVRIDGVEVVDNSGAHGPKRVAGAVHLDRGRHLIEVHFADYGFGALVRLLWMPPGSGIETIVPGDRLDPGTTPD